MTLKRTSTPSRDGDVCGGLTIPTRDCHRVVGTPSTDSRVILYVSAILGVWEVGGCDNVHPATLLTWPSTTLKLLSSTPFHYSTFRFLGWDPDGRPFLDMSQRCPTFSMASSNKLATPQRLGQLSAESMGVNRCQQSSFVAAEAEGLAGALQNESVHTSQDHVKNVDQTYDAFNKYGENWRTCARNSTLGSSTWCQNMKTYGILVWDTCVHPAPPQFHAGYGTEPSSNTTIGWTSI